MNFPWLMSSKQACVFCLQFHISSVKLGLLAFVLKEKGLGEESGFVFPENI